MSKKFLMSVASIIAVTSLSGCLSGGNGGVVGAGGSGGGAAGFEAAYDAVAARAPTTDMPTSLDATYTGQFKVGVNNGTAQFFGTNLDPQLAEVVGDLDIDVAWTENQVANPFSGSATNIVATLAGTSTSVPITGDLTVTDALPFTLNRVNTPSQVIAGQTIPELNTGAFLFHMTGRLENDGEQGDATVQFGGNFFGPGGNAMVGAVVGGINDLSNPSASIFDAGIGGTFYATQ